MKDTDRDALDYIIRVSGKAKIHIVILLLVQIILGISSVFYALLLRDVIDAAVSHDLHGIRKYILLLALLILIQIGLRAFVRFLREYAGASFENAFKGRLFRTLLTRDYGPVTAVHSAEWMNRLTSDSAVISEGLATIVPGIGEMLTKMVGAAVAILIIEPRFGFIIIPGGLIFVILTYVFRRQLKKLHKQVQEEDGRVRTFMQERLESLAIVKAYGVEDKSLKEAGEGMLGHKKARVKRNHFSNICNVGFAGAMNGAYLLGVIYSAYGIYNGTVTYGTLMALLQLISQIQAPFANITGYMPKYYSMIASAERMMEAEELAEDVGVGSSPENMPGVETTGNYPAAGQKVSQGGSEDFTELGLTGASFSYVDESGETEVINDFDLDIKRGDFLALTGPSGCGKSTVLKLLMNLYPLTGGSKFVRMEGGEDKVLDASWRRLFAYVPQGNLLISGTIRDIVTFASADAGDEKLKRALKIACADDFVGELADGVDTVLKERGSGLSEGQMQRLAIARAVCSDRPVLLLDEATSALDIQTEERLLENLKEMTDKTVILVTHRQAAVAACTRSVAVGGEKT
ncbi:MAG: ABC transporter ATP-binding protein/permease [Lachnospiraceae bacterium]|nr:ABC transporter ATP-binding protein/permease [Lachnospiraceae bacterium]